jgi:hypothetical protein
MKNGLAPEIRTRSVLSDFGAATVETRKVNAKNNINVNNLHQILDHYESFGL